MKLMDKRGSGVLLHLSSLPSPGGIGTMGQAARDFVDFLAQAGQCCWQLLPICPTGFGDSPYQSPSSFAGNPYFIDPEQLVEQGLLEAQEWKGACEETDPERVDYGMLYDTRYTLLRIAAQRFLEKSPEDFGRFCASNAYWLENHALFMALKNYHGGASWHSWKYPLKERQSEALADFSREHAQTVAMEKAVQYLFFRQWGRLKEYANEKGISVIGDMPIYVALDSVEVWAHRELFQLDEEGIPREVAGCPPDGFAANGQLWGNPLFDWEFMAGDGYQWWIKRVDHLCQLYDAVRIDHFRGLDSYYCIPYGSADARVGRWRQGPGLELLRALGDRPLLAEDLGFLTPSVRQLLQESGYPGMKVVQFGFDSRDGESDHLPHNHPERCVAYLGTHDNDTMAGWLNSAGEDAAYAAEYLRLGCESSHWDALCALWSGVARLTVVQGQDLLGLGSASRMNTPGTLGGNWCWRARQNAFTQNLAQAIRRKMELYGRIS